MRIDDLVVFIVFLSRVAQELWKDIVWNHSEDRIADRDGGCGVWSYSAPFPRQTRILCMEQIWSSTEAIPDPVSISAGIVKKVTMWHVFTFSTILKEQENTTEKTACTSALVLDKPFQRRQKLSTRHHVCAPTAKLKSFSAIETTCTGMVQKWQDTVSPHSTCHLSRGDTDCSCVFAPLLLGKLLWNYWNSLPLHKLGSHFCLAGGQFDKQFADEFHAADHSRVNLAFRRPFLRADGQLCFWFSYSSCVGIEKTVLPGIELSFAVYFILTLEGGKKEPDAKLNVQKKPVSVWPSPASLIKWGCQ